MADLGNMIASCVLIIMTIVFIVNSVHSWRQNDEMIAEMKKYDPLKEAHISQETVDQQDLHRDLQLSDTVTLPLTPDQVKKAVDHIKKIKYDPELAHSDEDDVFWVVLVAIADGKCDGPRECAKEALKSRDINFPRYYS